MTDQQLATTLINLPYRSKDRARWRFIWERTIGWVWGDAGWVGQSCVPTDPSAGLALRVASENRIPIILVAWPGGSSQFWRHRWFGELPSWVRAAIVQLFQQLNEGTI